MNEGEWHFIVIIDIDRALIAAEKFLYEILAEYSRIISDLSFAQSNNALLCI